MFCLRVLKYVYEVLPFSEDIGLYLHSLTDSLKVHFIFLQIIDSFIFSKKKLLSIYYALYTASFS